MVDERLSALAVNSYDTVEIKPTTNALDICERAYRMNWRIENHMSTTLCILHNNHHDGSPNIRIDHVLTTKRMPADPHNLALENSLRNGLPLVESIEIDPTNDWLLLERKDRFCLGLQRIVMAGAGDDYEKLDTTEDNNWAERNETISK